MLPLTPIQVRDLTLVQTRSCKPRHIDVWLLSCEVSVPGREFLESLLSPEERERAGRFRFAEDRVRSIVARGGLRRILSSYCGVSPDSLEFETGSHGKPSLHSSMRPATSLEFNVSHSGDYVLIGVTSGVPCGVDIERGRANTAEIAIAERFFCPREAAWLSRTEKGFLRLWATKESIIKAVGRGLSIPLSDVDVTDIVEGKTSAITLRTSSMEPQTLWLKELSLVPDYASAVATVGEARTVRLVGDN